MSEESDAQAIIENAIAGSVPSELADDARYSLVVPKGASVRIIDPLPDSQRAHPQRVTGESVVLDVPSFTSLWEKHSDGTSELFADPAKHEVVGVLNADDAAGLDAGHRDHRLVLDCRLTDAWKAWAGNDGKLMDQRSFAEHIEERVIDVVDPSGADMLELAQTFEANSAVRFKSAQILSTSQRSLVFEETIAAKAGQTGQIEIPKEFTIGVAPFEGGDAYRIVCRLRYRITDGVLRIGYKMTRPEDVLRTAFEGTANAVSEACGRIVLTGVAPAART